MAEVTVMSLGWWRGHGWLGAGEVTLLPSEAGDGTTWRWGCWLVHEGDQGF